MIYRFSSAEIYLSADILFLPFLLAKFVKAQINLLCSLLELLWSLTSAIAVFILHALCLCTASTLDGCRSRVSCTFSLLRISLFLPTAFLHQTIPAPQKKERKKENHMWLLSKEDVWRGTESEWKYFTVIAIIFLLKITPWTIARIRLQYGRSTCFLVDSLSSFFSLHVFLHCIVKRYLMLTGTSINSPGHFTLLIISPIMSASTK